MTVSRTIEIRLTPQELAELFCEMYGEEQADFFAAIKPLADKWPGAGWCVQSCDIVSHLNPDGRTVLQTLAGHLELSK